MRTVRVVAAMAILASASCTSGRKFDSDRVSDIRPGVTTRAEIVEWFGSPYQQTTLGAGKTVLRYTYVYARAGMYTRARSKALVVDFDANDIVASWGYSGDGTTSSGSAPAEPAAGSAAGSAQVCRPLEPDEEVTISVGTCFVSEYRMRMTQPRSETVQIQRWQIVSVVGKKMSARFTASQGSISNTTDPMDIIITRSPMGKGEPEIVSVPAGRFRCKKMTMTGKDWTSEQWHAKGLPSALAVRVVQTGPNYTATTELVRIENATVAPPPPSRPETPAIGPVGLDDDLILAVGTCFTTEGMMKMEHADMPSVTRATVTALDQKKGILKTVSEQGDVETETTSDFDLGQGSFEGALEIIEVPAGRFRCKKSTAKSTSQLGTTVTETWMAKGIPVMVRQVMMGPKMSSTTELTRIENAKIAKGALAVQGDMYVLVIGVNEYGDANIPALKFAEQDARAVSDFFATGKKSPATQERVRLLVGKEATRISILKAVREHLAARTVREEDTVVLYFAGHAFADANDTYLAGSDAQLEALPETAISGAALREYWDQIRAGRKVLVTDACHVSELKGLKGGSGVAKGWASSLVIASSGANELSADDEGAGRGVFAAAFLGGLGGEADEDKDGRVTGDELSKYLVREVAARTRGKQTPVVQAPSGGVTIPLSR